MVNLLLIAEAPPSASDRYFYFPDVFSQDSLFRETARAILGREPTRENKAGLLTQLRDRGVFLIDACLDPLDGPISIDMPRLVGRVRRLNPKRIIIVKAPVFDRVYEGLRAAELPVINARIPFPASGQQVLFRRGVARALRMRPARTQGG